MLKKFVAVALIIGLVSFTGWRVYSERGQSNASNNTDTQETEQQKGSAKQTFDKTKYATSKPGSIWWVVNKSRPLPGGYAPPDLVLPNIPRRTGGDEAYVSKQIAPDLEAMVAAAKKDGINLMLASGYRSYGLQVSVYNQNIKTLGQKEADRVSAKPGTSEHQTGLSLDIGAARRQCEIQECFGSLPEGKWIAANASKYGFIIRYPKGKESTTGYSYEPWHIRYVGKELAAEMKKQNIQTLEEFFGL